MKILFLMTDPGNLKYYYETLRALLRNEHYVHVAFFNIERQAKYMLHEKLKAEFPESFSWGQASGRRSDVWQALCVAYSWAIDYLFFLVPYFRNAHRLRERVEIRIIPSFRWLMTRCPRFKTPGGVAFMARLLRMIDEAIPASRKMKKFIRHQKPDIVLVTPLLSHSGLQSEYLRAARKLGVVTAHCVTSWDNLTTKGALRGNPDFMIMWNETQKKEAMELHGVSSDRIIVTGAQYFDEWFMHKPSRSRKEFCGINGLSPDRLILLYMCSSNFMAPNEKDFVLKWIRTIRTSESPELAEAGILIRPYPEYVDQWKNVDFSVFGNVVVWPPAGEYPLTEETKSNFFDSIYHSFAVVGVNTTAMIESAIIGRCVLSVLAPELNESQSNTIHFNYMRQENGGFLYLAKDIDEHVEQLRDILSNGDRMVVQIGEFVKRFARPHGMSQACVPIVAKAIEGLKGRPPFPDPLTFRKVLWRGMLYPLALALLCGRLVTRHRKKQQKIERKSLFRAAADHGGDPLEYIRGEKR